MNRSALILLGFAVAVLFSVQTARAEIISGAIRTAMNDTPIIGATVKLSDSTGEHVATVTTDKSGEYRIVGVSPGSYRIAVFSPMRGQKIVDKDVPVEQGRINRVDFTVGPKASMWGQAINKYNLM